MQILINNYRRLKHNVQEISLRSYTTVAHFKPRHNVTDNDMYALQRRHHESLLLACCIPKYTSDQ